MGEGIRQDCKSPEENLLKLFQQLPDKNKEQLASSIIKNKCDSAIETNEKSASVTLVTGNRKRILIVHDGIKKHLSFSEENLDNFRVAKT